MLDCVVCFAFISNIKCHLVHTFHERGPGIFKPSLKCDWIKILPHFSNSLSSWKLTCRISVPTLSALIEKIGSLQYRTLGIQFSVIGIISQSSKYGSSYSREQCSHSRIHCHIRAWQHGHADPMDGTIVVTIKLGKIEKILKHKRESCWYSFLHKIRTLYCVDECRWMSGEFGCMLFSNFFRQIFPQIQWKVAQKTRIGIDCTNFVL